MSTKSLGKLIRRLRKQKGLSLRELANDVDVSHVNISHIENGRVTTSRKVIQQLAKALDYDLDKLLAEGDIVGEDIEKIIKNTPTAVPEFLRTAKDLSEEEWRNLTEQVKNMKDKK